MWIKGINSKPDPPLLSISMEFYLILRVGKGEAIPSTASKLQELGGCPFPICGMGWNVSAAQAASCWAPSCATSSVLKPPPRIWVSILMHPVEMIPPFLSPSLCPGTARAHTGITSSCILFLDRNFLPLAFTHKTYLSLDAVQIHFKPPAVAGQAFWVGEMQKKTPHRTTCLAAGISSEGKHGVPQICCNCLGKGFSKAAVLQALLLRCVCNSLLLISSEHLPEAQHLHLQIDMNLKVSDKERQEMGIVRGIEGYSWNILQVQAKLASSFHSLSISTPHFPLNSTDRRYTQTAASLGQELCLW